VKPDAPKGSSALAKKLLGRLSRRQRELVEAATLVAERVGAPAYLVGGPVRDLVLGSRTGDLDLALVGDATVFAKALADHLGARVTIHRRFGTATLMLADGLRLDVATARRESYVHPAALPDVSPGTIHEDLFRRDFTINAMAVRLVPQGGEILAPFGGLEDLRRGLLRALHEGSYRDDPTRIFRGARYAARYRLRFSREDGRLIRSVLADKMLERLSRDRLFQEVKLFLGELRPEAVLKILENLGVLKALDPALAIGPNTIAQMRRIRLAWERHQHLGMSPELPRWRLYFMVLLLSVPSRVRRRVGQHLGMKAPPLDALVMALKELPGLQERMNQKQLPASRIRRVLDRVSGEMRLMIWAAGGRQVRKRVEHYLIHLAWVKPALTGQDLKSLGFPPGPGYRRMLDLLLDGRLDGRLHSRDDEIAFLRRRFGRGSKM